MKQTNGTWIALSAVLAITARTALGLPQVVQEKYQWFNDDGTELTATWKQGTNTAHTGQFTNENIRLRFALANTGLEAEPAVQYRLQYATNRYETFSDVPTSITAGPFVMAETPNYANGTPTTPRLRGTGIFQPGQCVESNANQTAAIGLEGGNYINLEYCFKALPNTEGGRTYYFQLSKAGFELDQYDVYPEITFTIRPSLNNSGETDLTASSATLQGEVTDTGGETPAVYVCWGESSGYGGTATGSWDTVVDLGNRSGAFSTPVSELIAGTDYHYRCYATNAAGGTWTALDNFSAPDPTVEHTRTAYTVREDDVSLKVSVHLSNESGSPASVKISTSNGTATAGNDYTATSKTLTWPAGETTNMSITVSLSGDGDVEGTEEFYLVLSDTNNCTYSGSTTTTVSIIDLDGPPTAQFQTPTAAGGESVSPTNITVELSHGYASPVTVTYTRSDVDADYPNDYSTPGTTLVFPAFVTSSNIVVSVTNDTDWESDETLTLTITQVTPGTVGPGSEHTYTIEDDDVGLPDVDNWLGAANVTAGSATLRGQVTNTKGEAPHVYVCWGPTDELADRGAWSNEYDMGQLGVGTFSTNIPSGLTEGVTYYYRCFATNSSFPTKGTASALNSEPFTPAPPPSENLLVNYSGETEGDFPYLGQHWTPGTSMENHVRRTNAAPRGGTYSFSFRKDGGPWGSYGLHMFGDRENYFKVTWNGQYAEIPGYHPNGGIRPGFALSGAAHTRARVVGSEDTTFAYALFNSSRVGAPAEYWMVNSNTHNNVAYQEIAISNSFPMAATNIGDNVRPALSRLTFDGSGEQLFHGDDFGLYATFPKLELLPTPTNPVAFPLTPYNMTSEMRIQARNTSGTIDTTLYGLYTADPQHMDGTAPWNFKAWELIENPSSVFSIPLGEETLMATNNSGWHNMHLQFNPAAPNQAYTGLVRIATSDPNDWYGGGGKLLNSIVYEEYVLTATSAPTLSISVNDRVVTELDGTDADATFTISLSSTAPEDVSVEYATANGSALSGTDYGSRSGTAVITAGLQSTNITVSVIGDNEDEGDELFYLNLSNGLAGGQSVSISKSQGICTIDDDDDSPYPRGTIFRMK